MTERMWVILCCCNRLGRRRVKTLSENVSDLGTMIERSRGNTLPSYEEILSPVDPAQCHVEGFAFRGAFLLRRTSQIRSLCGT